MFLIIACHSAVFRTNSNHYTEEMTLRRNTGVYIKHKSPHWRAYIDRMSILPKRPSWTSTEYNSTARHAHLADNTLSSYKRSGRMKLLKSHSFCLKVNTRRKTFIKFGWWTMTGSWYVTHITTTSFVSWLSFWVAVSWNCIWVCVCICRVGNLVKFCNCVFIHILKRNPCQWDRSKLQVWALFWLDRAAAENVSQCTRM